MPVPNKCSPQNQLPRCWENTVSYSSSTEMLQQAPIFYRSMNLPLRVPASPHLQVAEEAHADGLLSRDELDQTTQELRATYRKTLLELGVNPDSIPEPRPGGPGKVCGGELVNTESVAAPFPSSCSTSTHIQQLRPSLLASLYRIIKVEPP